MRLSLAAIRECLDGAVPSAIATCAADGTPNISYVSHVQYVDESHAALSYQFFSKTRQNVLANRRAAALVIHPETAARYRLELEYLRTETEGPLFEKMKARLAGIASYTGTRSEKPLSSTGPISAIGRPAPEGGGASQEEFLKAVQGKDAPRQRITAEDLDVVYLRYNPVENLELKPWEYEAGIIFGQIAVLQGLIVLSHPYTLPFAVNKMYFQHFPETVRPRTVITRDIANGALAVERGEQREIPGYSDRRAERHAAKEAGD